MKLNIMIIDITSTRRLTENILFLIFLHHYKELLEQLQRVFECEKIENVVDESSSRSFNATAIKKEKKTFFTLFLQHLDLAELGVCTHSTEPWTDSHLEAMKGVMSSSSGKET